MEARGYKRDDDDNDDILFENAKSLLHYNEERGKFFIISGSFVKKKTATQDRIRVRNKTYT